ncbi:hypothetical protein GCM10009716_31760 [Streptomyces sodiiphilus]|uniref:Uncharacterized protein n=1 Tax=Streptomyces sodiiphilus TaxID=226217 RepID=A0ABN2PFX7_9ACTN
MTERLREDVEEEAEEGVGMCENSCARLGFRGVGRVPRDGRASGRAHRCLPTSIRACGPPGTDQ